MGGWIRYGLVMTAGLPAGRRIPTHRYLNNVGKAKYWEAASTISPIRPPWIPQLVVYIKVLLRQVRLSNPRNPRSGFLDLEDESI